MVHGSFKSTRQVFLWIAEVQEAKGTAQHYRYDPQLTFLQSPFPERFKLMRTVGARKQILVAFSAE